MIILGTNSVKAAGGFDVANSVRFNSADSPKMVKSSTAGTRTKWTFSAWFKRSGLGASQDIMASSGGASSNNYLYLQINGSDQMRFLDYSNGNNCNKITNRKFRDVSAWYHVVIAVDTTDGTAEDRFKLYINGVRETSFATSANFSSSFATNMNVSGHSNAIGTNNQFNALYWDGYLAEIVLVDGTTLAPADNIGKFDEDSGIWKPIDVSGLTFGNNGFYLDFEASGNLGNDANGGTDFTETNLAATDQSTDTCTNNFATLNSIDTFYVNAALSEGNCKYAGSAGNYDFVYSTIQASQGKWYMEAKYTKGSNSNNGIIGITSKPMTDTANYLGKNDNEYGYIGNQGRTVTGGSFSTSGSYDTFTTGDIIGVYMDLDNNKLYWGKNGTVQDSGTGFDITASGSTANGSYAFAVCNFDSGGSDQWQVNFGNPIFTGTDKSDANSYGSFEYDPSAGTFDSASKDFYALNTKNLAEYG